MSKEIERQYSEILGKPPRLLTEVEKFILGCNGMLKKIYELAQEN